MLTQSERASIMGTRIDTETDADKAHQERVIRALYARQDDLIAAYKEGLVSGVLITLTFCLGLLMAGLKLSGAL